MAFTTPTAADILGTVLNELRDTGITYTNKSSKAYAIASTLSKEIEIAYKFFDNNFEQSYLANASDKFLEALGALFNVRRIQASKCNSPIVEQNVRFYVTSGTFGDINNSLDITIPAGTLIRTSPLLSLTNPIDYEVTVSTTLPAANSFGYVSARALNEGSSSRVGPNSLTVHTFTGYAQAALGTLFVTNQYGILNGSDRQTDQDYRYAISLAAIASQQSNETAFRFAAYQVPGVVDLKMFPYWNGIGTVGLFVSGQGNNISPALVDAVQSNIDQTVAHGVSATVYSPVQVGVTSSTKVTTRTSLTAVEQANLVVSLKTRMNNYIAALTIGQSLDIEDLVNELYKVDSRITLFGTTTGKPFDTLGVWRVSLAGTIETRVRGELLVQNNLRLNQHEILIPELSVSTPFIFTF